MYSDAHVYTMQRCVQFCEARMRGVELAVCLLLLGPSLRAAANSGYNSSAASSGDNSSAANSGDNSSQECFSTVVVASTAVVTFVGGLIVGIVSTLAVSCVVYNQYCCRGKTNQHSTKYVKPTKTDTHQSDDENDSSGKEYDFLPLELERKKSRKKNSTSSQMDLPQQSKSTAAPLAAPPPIPPPSTESLPPTPLPTAEPDHKTVAYAEPEHEAVAYAEPEVNPTRKKIPKPPKKIKKNTPIVPSMVKVKMRQQITAVPPPSAGPEPETIPSGLDPEQQYAASQLDAEYVSSKTEHYYVMDANKMQEHQKQQQDANARYL